MPPASEDYAKGPEALVVGLARTGDREAFAELVRRRQSWVRNLMRRCCGDPAMADDLAQQVFLQAYRKIRTLREPGRFGPWLERLAVRVWLQHRRKPDVLRQAVQPAECAAPKSDAAGLAVDLDRALAALSGPERLCLVLSYHAGMTHEEIAAAGKLPLGTVKAHIRRGGQRLRDSLSANGAASP